MTKSTNMYNITCLHLYNTVYIIMNEIHMSLKLITAPTISYMYPEG